MHTNINYNVRTDNDTEINKVGKKPMTEIT